MHDKYLKIKPSILVKKLQLMVIYMLNVKVLSLQQPGATINLIANKRAKTVYLQPVIP
jgi:aspartate carbamoyltransferase regulatory subunit